MLLMNHRLLYNSDICRYLTDDKLIWLENLTWRKKTETKSTAKTSICESHVWLLFVWSKLDLSCRLLPGVMTGHWNVAIVPLMRNSLYKISRNFQISKDIYALVASEATSANTIKITFHSYYFCFTSFKLFRIYDVQPTVKLGYNEQPGTGPFCSL